MVSRVCVYCVSEKNVSAFNVEHVLPQAFGTFEQNLTLRCVCSDCNGYFGENLELYFTRDGIEGIQRLQYGIKPAAGVRQLRRDRIRSIVIGEGPLVGAHADLVAEDGELKVTPVLQVGLLVLGKWLYFTEAQLEDLNSELPAPINNIKLLADSDAGYTRVTDLLAARGINFQREGISATLVAADDWTALDIQTTIDAPILRCVAKIAFNYMVCVAGAEFALRDELNVIRSFIRHGVRPPRPVVFPTSHPVLAADRPHLRQTDGHLVAVLWAPLGLIGQVSLFNEINYRVGLTEDFPAPLPPIRSGHHFDWRTRKITKLSETIGGSEA